MITATTSATSFLFEIPNDGIGAGVFGPANFLGDSSSSGNASGSCGCK